MRQPLEPIMMMEGGQAHQAGLHTAYCNQYALLIITFSICFYRLSSLSFFCLVFFVIPAPSCLPCFLLRSWSAAPTHLFCNFLPHSVRQGCLLLTALTVFFPSPARHLFDNNDICLPCNEKALFGQNMCLRHCEPDFLCMSPRS